MKPTAEQSSSDVRVFISYRRSDCQAQANGLHDGLVHRLPGASIFKDIDSIPYGADFEAHIRAEIRECDVVLVLIGDEWLDVRDETGARRLDQDEDFVRLEVETAMSTPSVRVIPVLVEGAEMPRLVDLPPSIQRLARLKAIELSDAQWRRDLAVLTSVVQQLATARGSGPKNPPQGPGKEPAETIGLGALDGASIRSAVGGLPGRFQTKDVSEARSVLAAHRTASSARNYHTMVGRHLLKHQAGLGIRSAGKSDNGRGEWWERFGTRGAETSRGAPHRQPEDEFLLDELAASTELDRDLVKSVVQDLHFAIDSLVADDCTVVLPPVVLRRAGDPVAAALLSKFLEHPVPELVGATAEELAAILDLPQALVEAHPVMWLDDVIVELANLHDIDIFDEKLPTADQEKWWAPYERVIDAWFAAWEAAPALLSDHHVSVLDRGVDVGAWLQKHLDRLEPAGLPVRPHAHQHRFRDGHTADLICRATKDGDLVRRGEWLVVKTQPDMADLGAMEQLRGQVEACRRELAAPGDVVKGLLVSDGVTIDLQDALHAAGFLRLSLVALGLRLDWASRLRSNVSPADADRVRRATLRVDVLPDAVMDALSVDPTPQQKPNQWIVDGVTYGKRADANKALAKSLGTYTGEQWAEAQRQHGLR